MNFFDLFNKKHTVDSSERIPESAMTHNSVDVKSDDNQHFESNLDNKPKASSIQKVHNLIILDESGSMEAIFKAALTGVNETLQTIREAQKENSNQVHFVSLVTFNSSRYNAIYMDEEANSTQDISKNQYRPRACTPLYDAMGHSITELRSNVKKGDIVLVTVITDGYENASREYNGTAIKALVMELKAQGWVFTYIGANQDVVAVASSMSIDNHFGFGADEESTGDMFEKENRCRKRFFNKASRSVDFDNLGEGYFEENN